MAEIRYGGGHEDANQELAHLRKIASATEGLIGKERTRRQELGLTGDAEKAAAETARLNARAQDELADARRREARVRGVKPTPGEGAEGMLTEARAAEEDAAAIRRVADSLPRVIEQRAAAAAAARKEAAALEELNAAMRRNVQAAAASLPGRGGTPRQMTSAEMLAAARYVEGRQPPPPPPPFRPAGLLGGWRQPVGFLGAGDGGLNEAYTRYQRAMAQETGRLYSQGLHAQSPPPSRGHAEEAQLDALRKRDDLSSYERNALRAATAVNALRNAEGSLADASRFMSVEMKTADQSMYRHGALTSEFLQAAMRGETTIREIGNQVAITSLKFAGWTLAATGVYGIVRAIGSLGKGAVDTESAVAELGRYITQLDTDKARRQIRDLAREMNLPIDVVGEQFAAAARLTGNIQDPKRAQSEAEKYARATLLLSRVGGLDPKQAQTYTASLRQGFRLSGDQLQLFIDQLNQLQNKMNIPFEVSAAATSAAAGTVRAARGDQEHLAALIAAGRSGGFSGQILGTTFSRAATMIGRPVNRSQLRSFGIDPDQTFNAIFEQAMKLVESGQVRGRGVIQLGTALSSPQLAGRGVVAALSRPDLYRRALGLEGRERERGGGSATRELRQQLSAVDEQIKRIGVTMATLGSELGQSGLLDGLYALLWSFNRVLDAANLLGEAFNVLPAPMRHMIALLGELAVAVAIMRRAGAFAEGGRLAQIHPGFGAFDNPAQREKRLAVAGLTAQQEYASAQRESVVRAETQAQLNREIAAQQYVKESQRYESMSRAGTLPAIGTPQRDLMDRRLVATANRTAAADLEFAAAKERVLAAEELVVRTNTELTAVQNLQAAQVRDHLIRNNIPLPPGYAVGDTRGAQYLGPMTERVTPAEARPFFVAGPATADRQPYNRFGGLGALPGDQPVRAATTELDSQRNRMKVWADSTRQWANSAERTNTISRGAGRAAAAAAEAAAVGATALKGAGSGIGRLAGGLATIGAALGPLDLALVGLAVGVPLVISTLNRRKENERQIKDWQNARPYNREQVRDLRSELDRASKRDQPGFIGRTIQRTPGVGGLLYSIGSEEYDFISGNRGKRQAAQDDADRFRQMEKEQKAAAALGKPVPYRVADDITRDVRAAQRDRVAGLTSQAQFDKSMTKFAEEAKTALNPTRGQMRQLRGALSEANVGLLRRRFLAQEVAALDDKGLGTYMQQQAQQLQSFGADTPEGRQAFQALDAAYQSAVHRYAGSGDLAELQNLENARQAFTQAITQSAQRDLSIALTGATTERERRAAYATAAQQLSRISERSYNRYTRSGAQEQAARFQLDQDRQSYSDATRGMEPGVAKALGVLPFGTVAELRRRIAKDKQDVAQFGQDRKHWKEEYAKAKRDQAEAEAGLRDQSYADRQQGRQIDLALGQSRNADPVTNAQAAVREAQRQRRDAIDTYGRGSRQDRQAQTEINNAKRSVAQARLQEIQSIGKLQEVQAGGDPVASARAALASARRALAYIRAHRKDFSPDEYRQALEAVIQAQRALGQSIVQQANDLNNVMGEIAQARDDGDPVAQAADALRTAQNVQIDPTLKGKARQVAEAQKQLGVIQAQNQGKQAAQELAKARGDYVAALAGDDPRVAAQEAIKNDRLAISQAKVGSAAWYTAKAQLLRDQRQLQQANQDFQQARYEYLESLTTDPVKQAQLQESAANAAVKGTKGAERLRAKARANQAHQATIAATISDREDTIDFNLTMEKITREEAISQLRSLANTRGITKQTRREILRRIKALQQESDQEASGFALDVGQIKLPTIYDVRRALAGARQGRDLASNTHMRSDVTFNIEVNDVNAARTVYGQIDRAMKTNVRARMRTAGMRG